MYTHIFFFNLMAFEWICFCLKWKKQQFILPLSILQWYSKMLLLISNPQVWSLKRMARIDHTQPSSSPVQLLTFSLAQEFFWPIKNQSVHFPCRMLWLLFDLLLFGRSVMSNSLWPHGLQHVRLSCPSQSPRVRSDSCPCHPTISSPAVCFSCPQSFPASGSFQWVNSSCQVARILGRQHQSFQWVFRVDFL